tara:strand:- start:128 stop:280 length:153 start_codon:yes stop_codon:yes gene_type:complete
MNKINEIELILKKEKKTYQLKLRKEKLEIQLFRSKYTYNTILGNLLFRMI